MLTSKDIRGVCAMIPTPCKEGAGGWNDTDTVNLDETARMIENLIQAGIGSIAACGTTGECAALLWEEKQAFIDTIVQVNRGRVPLFAGATSLGTRETIRQMRGLREIGADGAFVGLPLWQTPTVGEAVQWFADLAEACPDIPIMVYANPMFFKFTFPTPFWDGVAKKAPTVITNKTVGDISNLLDNVRVAGHQVNFMTIDRLAYPANKMLEGGMTALWSTSSCMGPEPVVAFMDAILARDQARIDAIFDDMRSVPSFMPRGQEADFAKFNAQAERARFNAAGYVNCGPMRPPYKELPDDWRNLCEAHAKAWVELRKKYAKAAV